MDGLPTLTDEQYLYWLTEGWIELTPQSLDAEFHRSLYDRATGLYDLAAQTQSRTSHLDYLGDNLRAQIPELDSLLSDPAIDGALTDILGPDYLIHPHSYCHRSGPDDQVFHQDGNLPWNERGHYRVHRPDWAMLFYYPQDVDESNGPTEIVPGTQYWTVDHEIGDDDWHRGDRLVREGSDRDPGGFAVSSDDLDERDRIQQQILDDGFGIDNLPRRFVHVPAGTAVLAHYDLVHRGSRSLAIEAPRYMYKFYFARTRSPEREVPRRKTPTSSRPRIAPAQALDTYLVGARTELEPVVARCWQWAHGQPADPLVSYGDDSVEGLAETLRDGREDQRVEAAYRLGWLVTADDAECDAALDVLSEALSCDQESVRRAASHGLRLGGTKAVEPLASGTESPTPGVRRAAIAGLGGLAADISVESLVTACETLCTALNFDADSLARSNAAYSLGQLARFVNAPAERIGSALIDRLELGTEPINADSWELQRSTVRQSAAFALVQLLANQQVSAALLDRIIDGPLRDQDRYVQGLMTEAVSRASNLSAQQQRRAFNWLSGRRWNPSPRRTQ